MTPGPWRLESTEGVLRLQEETLDRVWRIHGKRRRRKKQSRTPVTANARWTKSNDLRSSLVDRLMELRLVLKAPYFDGGFGALE